MKLVHALASGLAGALALTALHEVARRVSPDAPRVDEVGMRVIAKSMRKMDRQPPDRKTLFNMALLGDLISNGLYYSLLGIGPDGKGVWLRGGLLGLLAGAGAVTIPSLMGVESGETTRTPATRVMAVAWYLQGGLVAALVYSLLRRRYSP